MRAKKLSNVKIFEKDKNADVVKDQTLIAPTNKVKLGVSYAQVTSHNAEKDLNVRDNQLPQYNYGSDIQDLKELMKQLMSQIANMLQLITTLISKSNGNN